MGSVIVKYIKKTLIKKKILYLTYSYLTLYKKVYLLVTYNHTLVIQSNIKYSYINVRNKTFSQLETRSVAYGLSGLVYFKFYKLLRLQKNKVFKKLEVT